MRSQNSGSAVFKVLVCGSFFLCPQRVISQTQSLVAPRRVADTENNGKPKLDTLDVIRVFLNGTLRSTPDANSANSAATGALGFAFRNEVFQFVAQLNVAAKQDTVKSNPGRTILLPGNGGLSSGIFELRVRPWSARLFDAALDHPVLRDIRKRLHLRGYISASSYNWQLDSASKGTGNPLIANISGEGLGLSYAALDGWVDDEVESPSVQLVFDIARSWRRFDGDVLLPANEALRAKFVGSPARTFSGWEAGASILYNTIQGSLVYYDFGLNSVGGLGSGQLAIAFTIQAPILTGTYHRADRKSNEPVRN